MLHNEAERRTYSDKEVRSRGVERDALHLTLLLLERRLRLVLRELVNENRAIPSCACNVSNEAAQGE